MTDNIRILVNTARQNGVEVIFVQHEDGMDAEITVGKNDIDNIDEIQPLPNERKYIKSTISCFIDTGLEEYLESKNEDILIMTGSRQTSALMPA